MSHHIFRSRIPALWRKLVEIFLRHPNVPQINITSFWCWEMTEIDILRTGHFLSEDRTRGRGIIRSRRLVLFLSFVWLFFSLNGPFFLSVQNYQSNRRLTRTCMKFVTSTISCFKIVCTYTKYLHLFTSLVRVQVDCGYEKVLGKILFFTSISCPIPCLNFHNNVHPNRRNQDLPTWRVSRRTPPNTVASCRTPSSRSSWWSPMRPPGNNDLWKGDTSLIQMENCHQQYLIS